MSLSSYRNSFKHKRGRFITQSSIVQNATFDFAFKTSVFINVPLLVIKSLPHLLQRCQLRISFLCPIWLSFSLLIEHGKYTVTLRPCNRQESALPETVSPCLAVESMGDLKVICSCLNPNWIKVENSLTNVYDIHLSLVSPLCTLLYQQIVKLLFSFYFFDLKFKIKKKSFLNKIRKMRSKKLNRVINEWLYP